jgi:uncharacterized protein yddF|nr:MAG TPA: hypothetical protein [Caudoviricetes sp.]
MNNYILTDLESLINAPKRQETNWCYGGHFRNEEFKDEDFTDEKVTFEVAEEVMENMSKKQMKDFVNNLINDDKYIDDGVDENIVYIHLKDIVVIIFADEYADIDEIEDIAKYADSVQIHYMKKPLPIAILNTTILTADGDFTLQAISLDEAKQLIKDKEILSAVGHESTAQILTELLEVDVPLNRIQFKQQSGQKALCFKLNGRPQEGTILTAEEIEKIGYEFKLLEMK